MVSDGEDGVVLWGLRSLVMKSRAMTSNGFAFGSGNIGVNGALVGRVLTL